MQIVIYEMKLSIIQTFGDYNDDYILVKSDIIIKAAPEKNDATAIDDADDLDLVKMIEYSSRYLKQNEVKGFFYKWSSNVNNSIEHAGNFKYFKYKTKLLRNTVAEPTPINADGILIKCNNCSTIKWFKYFFGDHLKYHRLNAKLN